MFFSEATREKAKLRLALTGVSGSGKTLSALYLAYGLTGDWSRVALIDTEHGRAKFYADRADLGTGRFLHAVLSAPFTPDKYKQYGPRGYDFRVDAEALLASFRTAYGIDLDTAHLHWWTFRRLMFGLPRDTPFMERVHYRVADVSGLSKRERKHYQKMRALYALDAGTRTQKTAAQRDAARRERLLARYDMASALRQTQPQMVSAAQYLCEGLIVGMRERTPSVLSTARSLASQVASTMQDALEIHSPSQLTAWMGEMVMIGFAYGMERKMSYVRRTARKVGDLLGKEAARIEEQIADIERQAEEREQAKALEGHKQALAEKYEELGKAEASEREKIREEIAELEADWDEKQRKEAEQAQKEALNARLDALEEFREEYEDALAEIEDAQTSMADKLSDYGALFTRTKDGDKERFELGDLAKQRDEIIAYGEALDELKARGTPADLMAEIVQGMSIEDGTDYMRELIRMTDEELTAYLDEWTAYQQAARDIAAQYYSDQLSALETEFTARMGEELADVPEQGKQIGVDTVDGMIVGMASREGPLAAAAAAIVRTALDAMRAAADINSPSKVAEKEIGRYIPQGVQVGMERAMPDLLRAAEDEMRRLSTQMRAAVDYETGMRPLQIAASGTALGVSDAQLAQLARMIGAVLTPIVSAGEREIKMYLDGKEVARALVPDIRKVEDQSPRIESD